MLPAQALSRDRTKPAPTRRVKQHRLVRPPQDFSDAPVGTYTWRLTITTTPKSALHPIPVETVTWERVPLRTHPNTTRRPGPRPSTAMLIPTATTHARRPGPRLLHTATGTATGIATKAPATTAITTSTTPATDPTTHTSTITNPARSVHAAAEPAAAQLGSKLTTTATATGKGSGRAAKKRTASAAVAEAGEGGRRKSLRLMFAKEGGGL